MSQRKTLKEDVELIDTIIFKKIGRSMEGAEYSKIQNCRTFDELITVSSEVKDCRIAAITLEKADLKEPESKTSTETDD